MGKRWSKKKGLVGLLSSQGVGMGSFVGGGYGDGGDGGGGSHHYLPS